MQQSGPADDSGEAEFALVYRFLTESLPEHFRSGKAAQPLHRVGEEYDGDYTASFLMTYDEFTESVPAALKEFISTLAADWTIVGSFDLITVLDSRGQLLESPSFTVTKAGVYGEVNMEALRLRKGSNLRRSRP